MAAIGAGGGGIGALAARSDRDGGGEEAHDS